MSLNILSVCAEFAPLSKVGGLADVTSGLARYLTRSGHKITTLLPRSGPNAATMSGTTIGRGELAVVADAPVAYTFLKLPDQGAGDIIALDCPDLFDAEIYGAGDAAEAHRFLALSASSLELCKILDRQPDILHCHDWHTAMAAFLMKASEDFPDTRSVLTIHNIGYQGVFPAAVVDDIAPEAVTSGSTNINFLEVGVGCVDAITTVSPTHAAEMLTPEYGMGLEELLAERSQNLSGILNGVDYTFWDPETDKAITTNYTLATIDAKRKNKSALLKEFGAEDTDAPLVGMVSRLVYQKGSDMLVEALPDLFSAHSFVCAILGDGDPAYVETLAVLAEEYPDRLHFIQAYNEDLSHRIMAGSDILVVPSRYEPCGLTQMYAMRYGTVPVVRKTGGLADSVQHFDPATGEGNGSVFEDANPDGLKWGLSTALGWYSDKPLWQQLVHNGMTANFSWDEQGKIYESLYQELAQSR